MSGRSIFPHRDSTEVAKGKTPLPLPVQALPGPQCSPQPQGSSPATWDPPLCPSPLPFRAPPCVPCVPVYLHCQHCPRGADRERELTCLAMATTTATGPLLLSGMSLAQPREQHHHQCQVGSSSLLIPSGQSWSCR